MFDLPEILQPQIPDRTFCITDYGGVGTGLSKNTAAFEGALAACAGAGGGTVLVPPGIWLTGPIRLRSSTRLHLAEGALLLFSKEYDDYPLVLTHYEGWRAVRCVAQISGDGLTNVAITGKGIIDGNGDGWRPVRRYKTTDRQWQKLLAAGGVVADEVWWPSAAALEGSAKAPALQAAGATDPEAYAPYRPFLRPVLLHLNQCRQVLLDGPTFQNSPAWCLHPRACEHLTVRNVTVRNPWYGQNGDGIDLESCRVAQVHDSTFDVGDDALCIKSGKDEEGRRSALPSELIHIYNCTVFHGHGGFVVGSEMSGGVRQVSIHDCTFIGTDKGLRFKSRRGRGGVVEQIEISNIRMKDIVGDAVVMDLYYFVPYEPDERPVTAATPCFRAVTIRDMVCTGARHAAMIRGLPEMPIQDIRFERVTVAAQKGVHCADARGITFRDCTIVPAAGPAFDLHRCADVKIEGS